MAPRTTSRRDHAPVAVTSPSATAGLADRHRAEQTLRRDQHVLAQVPMAVVAYDLHGAVTTWNDAAHRLLGWRPDEAIGRTLRELGVIDPEDPAHAAALRALGRGESWEGECDVQRRDGRRVRVACTLTPSHDRAGEIADYVGVLVDLSGNDPLGQILATNRARYDTLVERATDIVTISTADGTILYVSPSAARLHGHPVDELVGTNGFDLVHPDDQEACAIAWAAVLDGVDGGRHVEWRVRHGDGTWRTIEGSAVNRLDDPAIRGIVMNIRDVTERAEFEAQLAASEARFRALVQHAPDVILVVDALGRITYNSPSLGGALGYDDDLHGHNVLDYVHEDDRERYRDALRQVMAQPDHRIQVELRVLDSTGTWKWFDASATNPAGEGGIDGIVVNARDVTSRKLAQESSERRARQQAAVARLGELAVTGVEPLALFEEAARAIADGFDGALVYAGRYEDDGTDELQVHTTRGFTLASPAARVHVVPGMPGGLAATTGSACRETDLGDGGVAVEPAFAGVRSCMEALVRGAPDQLGVLGAAAREPGSFRDEDLHFVEALANVIGSAMQRLHSDRELQRVALRDGLTGLANRALLVDRIGQAIARRERHQRRIALLLLNVDRFKLVNETLGHEVGDELLVTVARRIEGCVRAEDTVARLGADEFAVLSEHVADVHEAVEIAQRITRAVSEPVRHGGHELVPSVSIGIAVDGIEWQQPLDPVREANTALHWAKEHGRSRFEIYDAGMRQLAEDRFEIESDLRRALLAGELEAWFQPQVSIGTGDVVAAETLVRWRHPERGLLAPGLFLGAAEDSGLIVPIGEQVLEAACYEAAQWIGRPGFPQSVSVNLSAAHLTSNGLDEFIAELLRRTGLPAECLTIEITEGALLDDVDAALGALFSLHQLGVRISVDDFGTGYSSLRYLTRLPVDEVKIDRSFVQVLDGDPAPRAIVSAVVAMGHALGLVVVAEGVETPHHLEVLRELGCDVGQGFLWSAALPAEDFRACVVRRGCHRQAARDVA